MREDIDIQVNNQSLRGVLEGPESFREVVILVHGFVGDMRGPNNIFEKLSNKLQERSIGVLRFSFRGTPPSEGNFQAMTVDSEVRDLRAVIGLVKERGFREVGILGESMGGSVVVQAYESMFGFVALWWTAFNFLDTDFKEYFKPEAQKQLEDRGYLLQDGFKVGKDFINEIDKIDIFGSMSQIKSPILFLHGDKDSEVPVGQSKKAFGLANNPKVIRVVEGAGHCFRDRQDEAINLTLSFIDKYF